MPDGAGQARWTALMGHARCAREQADPDLWFPVSENPVVARREAGDAIAICRACPVQRECLDMSLRHWNVGRHGIWGGLLPAEREQMRRRRPVPDAGDGSNRQLATG